MDEIKNFFNDRAAGWDADLPAVLPARGAIAMLSGAKPGVRMLDIACGTGVMEPELLPLGVGEIVGIDLAENMISCAQEKFAGEPRVRFVVGDLLDFCDAPFDAALMYNAYPHFSDKRAVLEKVASLLVPAGRFTVAHGAGRDTINAHHKGVASKVSVGLGPAVEEAAAWSEWFTVDTLVDRPDVYVISGVLK